MADSTSGVRESVYTLPGDLLCEWCNQPIAVEGRRKIRTRRFCRPAHRAAWHNRRAKLLVTELRIELSEARKHLDEADRIAREMGR